MCTCFSSTTPVIILYSYLSLLPNLSLVLCLFTFPHLSPVFPPIHLSNSPSLTFPNLYSSSLYTSLTPSPCLTFPHLPSPSRTCPHLFLSLYTQTSPSLTLPHLSSPASLPAHLSSSPFLTYPQRLPPTPYRPPLIRHYQVNCNYRKVLAVPPIRHHGGRMWAIRMHIKCNAENYISFPPSLRTTSLSCLPACLSVCLCLCVSVCFCLCLSLYLCFSFFYVFVLFMFCFFYFSFILCPCLVFIYFVIDLI